MKISKVSAINFRCLKKVELEMKDITVLFGPNGVGKTTILDTIWFIRDCAIKGTEEASAERSHGIGMLWDKAQQDDSIALTISTENLSYEVEFGFSNGRIEPWLGEKLKETEGNLRTVLERRKGSDEVTFSFPNKIKMHLPEPEKLALSSMTIFNNADLKSLEFEKLLRFVHLYSSRKFELFRLTRHGSEMDFRTTLHDRAINLWSVLRNLNDRRAKDGRFEIISKYMGLAFPSFLGLRLEQTGVGSVYCHFDIKNRAKEVMASGVPDGYLQLLVILTALFCEEKQKYSLVIFDEPETSLHPYAISVFAQAVREASENWNRQVVLATHSPVLISQFKPDELVVVEAGSEGETILRKVSALDEETQALLEEYSAGVLYMTQSIAAQQK